MGLPKMTKHMFLFWWSISTQFFFHSSSWLKRKTNLFFPSVLWVLWEKLFLCDIVWHLQLSAAPLRRALTALPSCRGILLVTQLIKHKFLGGRLLVCWAAQPLTVQKSSVPYLNSLWPAHTYMYCGQCRIICGKWRLNPTQNSAKSLGSRANKRIYDNNKN